jgi:uncharacterized membrane protein YozB (DUF420 family)
VEKPAEASVESVLIAAVAAVIVAVPGFQPAEAAVIAAVVEVWTTIVAVVAAVVESLENLAEQEWELE